MSTSDRVSIPLGATLQPHGATFALCSQHATAVELCLFDHPADIQEARRIAMTREADGLWQAVVPGIGAGQAYAYRVHGPYEPDHGHRFNVHKLLLDPYARAIGGTIPWDDRLLGYVHGDPASDLSFDDRDSAPCLPKCLVAGDDFDWGDDRPPRTPWSRTLIYECHVKGLTARHPAIPSGLRGTYAALASPPILEHLRSLGVTAVELLPVHQSLTRRALALRGLVDYWGYNTIGFFAPDARFSTKPDGGQVNEFKSMVKALHAAGLEVILDVVYNHTGEGDEYGPTICFRGIDNAMYYRLEAHDRRRYQNYAGCGNCLNANHPTVRRLILDSLRYWVDQMHVDGFRFDLSTVLARDEQGTPTNEFYEAVLRDPVLSQVKLIAEPWDARHDGYRLGTLPAGWAEWNDKYRDGVRRFWRGDDGQVANLARRLAGSEDLFAPSSRSPLASINFVACHDGFTLRDLVSYERKHNEDNGEENRDGHNDNLSRNWGVEGPTKDPNIVALREQMQRNFLLTLACSLGAPMIYAGDELGRTQRGNNNAYCHDSELNWVTWNAGAIEKRLLRFAKLAFRLRSRFPCLGQDRFFTGAIAPGAKLKDVSWLTEHGREMTHDDWHDGNRKTLGVLLHAGAYIDTVGDTGSSSQTALLILNASEVDVPFRLPMLETPGAWAKIADTARVEQCAVPIYGNELVVAARSGVLLEHRAD